MMFVHDAPPSVPLAKTHGEAELKLNFLAVALRAAAAPDRRGKSHIRPSGDLHVVEIEGDRLG